MRERILRIPEVSILERALLSMTPVEDTGLQGGSLLVIPPWWMLDGFFHAQSAIPMTIASTNCIKLLETQR